QKRAMKGEFIGLPVFEDFDTVTRPFDAVLITDVLQPGETCAAAVARFGVGSVLVPELLRIRMRQKSESAKGRPVSHDGMSFKHRRMPRTQQSLISRDRVLQLMCHAISSGDDTHVA